MVEGGGDPKRRNQRNVQRTKGPKVSAFEDALAWLYGRRRNGAERTSNRASKLLRALSLEPPKHVVHIVGTNGKGEAAARIARSLVDAGRPTVRFTSPHARSFCERVVFNEAPIAEDDVVAFVQLAISEAESAEATFFDLSLAMAVWVSNKYDATWFVAEAGVGAEGDATMALENVRLVVATNVSSDHEAAIGPGIEGIALNKSMAVRSSAPVVSSVAWPEASPFSKRAEAYGARFVDITREVDAEDDVNVALAVAACRVLGLKEAVCARAGEPIHLPCRWESFSLGDGRHIVFDGAHNAAALQRAVARLAPSDHVLLGAQAQKDVTTMLRILESHVNVWTTAVGEPPEVLSQHPRFIPDPETAFAHALADLQAGGRLIVLGSFRLVGALSGPYAAVKYSSEDRRRF